MLVVKRKQDFTSREINYRISKLHADSYQVYLKDSVNSWDGYFSNMHFTLLF